MAKKKVIGNKPTSPLFTSMVIADPKLEKKEKSDGRSFQLKEPWVPPGFVKGLQPGAIFLECYDKYYTVYDHRGNKLFYRIGEKTIKEIFKD